MDEVLEIKVKILSFDLGWYSVSYEEQVNGVFLKRRHFGPETGQWKGRNPQRPESWTTEGA